MMPSIQKRNGDPVPLARKAEDGDTGGVESHGSRRDNGRVSHFEKAGNTILMLKRLYRRVHEPFEVCAGLIASSPPALCYTLWVSHCATERACLMPDILVHRHPTRRGVLVHLTLAPEAYDLLRQRCPVGTKQQGKVVSRLLFEDAIRREARQQQERGDVTTD